MNGNFSLIVRVVRNTTGGLVRVVEFIRSPSIGVRVRIIELALWKHGDVTMKHASKRNVNVTRLINVRDGIRAVGVLGCHLILAIAESVGCFGGFWYWGKTWIRESIATGRRRTIVTSLDDGCKTAYREKVKAEKGKHGRANMYEFKWLLQYNS